MPQTLWSALTEVAPGRKQDTILLLAFVAAQVVYQPCHQVLLFLEILLVLPLREFLGVSG